MKAISKFVVTSTIVLAALPAFAQKQAVPQTETRQAQCKELAAEITENKATLARYDEEKKNAPDALTKQHIGGEHDELSTQLQRQLDEQKTYCSSEVSN